MIGLTVEQEGLKDVPTHSSHPSVPAFVAPDAAVKKATLCDQRPLLTESPEGQRSKHRQRKLEL